MDFLTKFGLNYNYLILFDVFSGWIEIQIVENMQAETVLDKLREFMANFGLITTLVSDNGSPFNGHQLAEFCNINRITHLFSPPYHPQSNALAERGVQTAKQSWNKMLLDFEREGEQSNIRKILVDFLFKYRNTPRSETGISPAELIFKLEVLTDLRLLRIGRSVETEIQEGISLAKFKINELIWVLKTGSSKNAKEN